MKVENLEPALLTRREIEWLMGKVKVSNGYQRKIKCDIRRKIRTFYAFELPLIQKFNSMDATAN